METNKDIATFYTKTRQEWRQWLAENCQTQKEICLIIFHKKSKNECVSYNEAVEEALCFGWIDSVANKRDVESTYHRFYPEKLKATGAIQTKRGSNG